MSSDLSIQRSASAVEPALVINRILEAGVRKAPNQTITYNGRDYTYREFEERVHRLAGALAAQGIKPGDTVAVMDWDTNRYLEAFFAIPMMGAVLHTVNVRLSPEQILYTINHAKDDAILVNSEFLPVLEELKDRIEPVKTYILLDDDGVKGSDSLPLAGEYEALLADAPARYAFPELDENTRATTFYTTGTTGLPKGVYFSHRQLVLHTFAGRNTMSGVGQGVSMKMTSTCRSAHVPCTPGASRSWPPDGGETGLPGPLRAGHPAGTGHPQVTFSTCTRHFKCCCSGSGQEHRPERLEGDHRWFGLPGSDHGALERGSISIPVTA